MKVFDRNERVITPLGPGKVISRMMKPPYYTEVASYSVLLDSKVAASEKPPFPTANGTTFKAEDVKEEDENSTD